jgi:SAM-dependent methyltransferase
METAVDLGEQLEYYRARSAEYDEWWLREGRYDRGAALNAQWFEEAAVVSAALGAFRPAGRVLELACGTGIWSEQLLPFASKLTLIDGSPEMLKIAAERVRAPEVRLVEADLFQWRPPERFDVVFFGFWLSHVPPERFAGFWQLVGRCLAPGGRVFFVDSRYDPTSTALDHHLPAPEATVTRRRLNDGREYRIVKVFYDPAELTGRLSRLGWDFEIRQTEHYFLYAHGTMREADREHRARSREAITAARSAPGRSASTSARTPSSALAPALGHRRRP